MFSGRIFAWCSHFIMAGEWHLALLRESSTATVLKRANKTIKLNPMHRLKGQSIALVLYVPLWSASTAPDETSVILMIVNEMAFGH